MDAFLILIPFFGALAIGGFFVERYEHRLRTQRRAAIATQGVPR